MPAKPPALPPSRTRTVREALRAVLLEGPAAARDLSARAGVRERDVPEHLGHLARSLDSRGERLVVTPATCLGCGYVFHGRLRLSRPSACPQCRSTRIEAPAFRIVPKRR